MRVAREQWGTVGVKLIFTRYSSHPIFCTSIMLSATTFSSSKVWSISGSLGEIKQIKILNDTNKCSTYKLGFSRLHRYLPKTAKYSMKTSDLLVKHAGSFLHVIIQRFNSWMNFSDTTEALKKWAHILKYSDMMNVWAFLYDKYIKKLQKLTHVQTFDSSVIGMWFSIYPPSITRYKYVECPIKKWIVARVLPSEVCWGCDTLNFSINQSARLKVTMGNLCWLVKCKERW